ncbi:type VII secretion-associated protein [Amycolatopsis sp. NPDC059657]|uniref:type VII secretion-associated protein n=1 Tax=Amycolatopsis sp. NPDC059657 TaxID=3346899 RepID=UPI003672FF2F
MTLRVAVDFGTSSTCVVASVNGRDPQVVVIDGQPLMSSAVFAAADGTLFVGQEAERQAAVDPARYEPNPKRRIDEGELLLGDSVLLVTDVVHAVLRRAVTEAKVLAGGADVNLLVLTHPADWGAIRTRLLRQAAGRLANEVALVPEPVAAAVFHAATFAPSDIQSERTVEFSGQPGQTIAVLDLGGGTVDVSVVRRAPAAGPGGRRGGFQVLATRGDPSFGGADIDQALLEHVGSLVSATDPQAWRQLVEGREMADRRRRRVLRQDVRGAKETLSRHAYTDVPMPPPFADAHVTREDLERLIASPLGRAVELTRAAVEDAGLRPQQLSAIFLVGGSSRIPMISRLVHERTGVVPTTLDQPETVVARGALRAVLIDPDRTGALPGSAVSGGPSGPRSLADERTDIVRPGEPRRASYPPAPQPVYSQVQAPPRPMPQQAPPVRQPSGSWHQPAKPKRKLPWVIGGVVLLVVAVVATLLVVLNGGEEGKQYAAYDYRFYAPTDWVQTTDNVSERQVVLRPGDLQTGNDLVSVQEYQMTYDGTANRQALVDELRTKVEKSSSHGAFAAEKSFAGKTVIYYQETKAAARLDWYVVAQGMRRVHVGCQYAVESVRPRIQAACEQAVRTLVIG